MRDFLIIVACFSIIVLALSFHHYCNIENLVEGSVVSQNEKQHVQRVRCPPNDIALTQKIQNTGYVNELMYKPETLASSTIDNQFQPLIKNYHDLNSTYDSSNDLPIGNINIVYMLNNNTTKLSL